jgi:hypothetical protein
VPAAADVAPRKPDSTYGNPGAPPGWKAAEASGWLWFRKIQPRSISACGPC